MVSNYIVDGYPQKITKNVTPDEPDNSNKKERSIAISEHPAQPEDSNNQVPLGVEILKLKLLKCS